MPSLISIEPENFCKRKIAYHKKITIASMVNRDSK